MADETLGIESGGGALTVGADAAVLPWTTPRGAAMLQLATAQGTERVIDHPLIREYNRLIEKARDSGDGNFSGDPNQELINNLFKGSAFSHIMDIIDDKTPLEELAREDICLLFYKAEEEKKTRQLFVTEPQLFVTDDPKLDMRLASENRDEALAATGLNRETYTHEELGEWLVAHMDQMWFALITAHALQQGRGDVLARMHELAYQTETDIVPKPYTRTSSEIASRALERTKKGAGTESEIQLCYYAVNVGVPYRREVVEWRTDTLSYPGGMKACIEQGQAFLGSHPAESIAKEGRSFAGSHYKFTTDPERIPALEGNGVLNRKDAEDTSEKNIASKKGFALCTQRNKVDWEVKVEPSSIKAQGNKGSIFKSTEYIVYARSRTEALRARDQALGVEFVPSNHPHHAKFHQPEMVEMLGLSNNSLHPVNPDFFHDVALGFYPHQEKLLEYVTDDWLKTTSLKKVPHNWLEAEHPFAARPLLRGLGLSAQDRSAEITATIAKMHEVGAEQLPLRENASTHDAQQAPQDAPQVDLPMPLGQAEHVRLDSGTADLLLEAAKARMPALPAGSSQSTELSLVEAVNTLAIASQATPPSLYVDVAACTDGSEAAKGNAQWRTFFVELTEEAIAEGAHPANIATLMRHLEPRDRWNVVYQNIDRLDHESPAGTHAPLIEVLCTTFSPVEIADGCFNTALSGEGAEREHHVRDVHRFTKMLELFETRFGTEIYGGWLETAAEHAQSKGVDEAYRNIITNKLAALAENPEPDVVRVTLDLEAIVPPPQPVPVEEPVVTLEAGPPTPPAPGAPVAALPPPAAVPMLSEEDIVAATHALKKGGMEFGDGSEMVGKLQAAGLDIPAESLELLEEAMEREGGRPDQEAASVVRSVLRQLGELSTQIAANDLERSAVAPEQRREIGG